MAVNVELIVSGIPSGQGIHNDLTDLEGVVKVDVNNQDNRIKIEYDPEDISLDEICHFIEGKGVKITY